MPRRIYIAEFKRDALALGERDGVPQAATTLGITENNLYRWRREARDQGEEAFRGKGVMTVEQAELACLSRELANSKEDNLILKKSWPLSPKRNDRAMPGFRCIRDGIVRREWSEALDVPRSGYYAWRKKPQSADA